MRAIPQELSSEIVKRYEEGQSSSHIVKEMGIPERTVLRYIRKAGLTIQIGCAENIRYI